MAHPFDDARVFRTYEPHELKGERYPYAWDKLGDGHDDLLNAADMVLPGSMVGVKDIVRHATGHRCRRCGHPYYVGKGLGVWEDDPAPSAEAIPLALFDGLADEQRQATAGRVHWSPCDRECAHAGPLRCLVDGRVAWQDAGSATTKTPTDHGIDTRTTYQAAYRILTVHHLNERKHDLRWWNLVALCQRCHLTIQRKVTMEDPWPWEHSEWFKPHAAAWYALRYLGENLTYTDTMARLDELLELGRREEAVGRMAL